MKHLKIILLVILTAFCANSYAQEDRDYAINLMYYNHGDSISLFWLPDGYDNFRYGVDNGYAVERRVKGTAQWTRITDKLLPVSNAAFENLIRTLEDAAVMQELIYRHEQGTVPEDDDPAPVSESYREMELLDDGDSEEEMMFKFGLITALTNVSIAKASAFFFTDKSVDSSAQYEYRVVFATGRQADKSQIVAVDVSVLTVLPKPTDFRADFTNKDVLFQWSVEDLSDIYSAYRVERSLDGETFVQVNNTPIIYSYSEDEFENTVVFKDTLVDRTTLHHYRMSGYSPFGIYGEPSDVLTGKGIPDFDIQLRIDSIAVNEQNEALIRWSVQPPEAEKLIKGFRIDKARSFEGEYQTITSQLLPANRRDYRDRSTQRTNYYRVHAIGFNENEDVASFPYFAFQMDSIPPAPPVGLRGAIDSLGVVRLEWDANTEDDIQAYRVFASNDNRTNSYFSVSDTLLITPFFTTVLPLNTLTNAIYYKVVAVDLNYNHSEMSEAFKMMKPDTIPPVKSLIKKVSALDGAMEIHWEISSSTDVHRLVLLRQITETGEITAIQEWTGNFVDTYTDTDSFEGKRVRYFLQTYDESGNMSEDVSFWETAKGSLPPCIRNLQATPNHAKGFIELMWERGDCSIEKIHIFRQVNGERTLLLTTLDGSQRIFEDARVSSGENYKYIVRAISQESSPAVYTEEIAY